MRGWKGEAVMKTFFRIIEAVSASIIVSMLFFGVLSYLPPADTQLWKRLVGAVVGVVMMYGFFKWHDDWVKDEKQDG